MQTIPYASDFSILYHIEKVPQIHAIESWRGGFNRSESGPGAETPHLYAIFGKDGRLMVLVGQNNDTPDSWQWADDPRYPADRANLGLRIGVNIAIYLMTH